jgi:phosphotransferase system IIA component
MCFLFSLTLYVGVELISHIILLTSSFHGLLFRALLGSQQKRAEGTKIYQTSFALLPATHMHIAFSVMDIHHEKVTLVFIMSYLNS